MTLAFQLSPWDLCLFQKACNTFLICFYRISLWKIGLIQKHPTSIYTWFGLILVMIICLGIIT